MTEPAAPEDDKQQPGPVAGFLADVDHLLATLADAVYTRLELVFLDLQDSSARLLSLVIWGLIGLSAAAMTLLLGALAVIFIFWDTHRVLAALAVTGLFGALALTAGCVIFSKLRHRQMPFAATVEEFARDRQRLNIQP